MSDTSGWSYLLNMTLMTLSESVSKSEPQCLKDFKFLQTQSNLIDWICSDACLCGWMKVEQRVEPAQRAAKVLSKKLQGCMQSQTGLEAERRMVTMVTGDPNGVPPSFPNWNRLLCPQKKLPLMQLSVSMAESLKDFDAHSSIRWQLLTSLLQL